MICVVYTITRKNTQISADSLEKERWNLIKLSVHGVIIREILHFYFLLSSAIYKFIYLSRNCKFIYFIYVKNI